jgi:hypothetical protein
MPPEIRKLPTNAPDTVTQSHFGVRGFMLAVRVKVIIFLLHNTIDREYERGDSVRRLELMMRDVDLNSSNEDGNTTIIQQ